MYLTIVNTIVDTTDEGEDLLSLLCDNHDRINTGLSFDNGAGAHKDLVKTYGGVTRVSTIALINGLKAMTLKGNSANDVQKHESEFSRTFKKLRQAGEELSDGQRKAYLLNGLGGLTVEWNSFCIDVQKEELKGSQMNYNDVLKQFKQLAPAIQETMKANDAAPFSDQTYFTGDNRGGRQPKDEVDAEDCWRCAGTWSPLGHGPDKCRSKNLSCNGCGKRGHVKAGCPSKGKTEGKDRDRESDKQEGSTEDRDKALAAVLKKMDARLSKIEESLEGEAARRAAEEDKTLASRDADADAEPSSEYIEFAGARF